jgi:hypothetical protein
MRPPVPQSKPDSTRQRVEIGMKNRSCDEMGKVAEAGRLPSWLPEGKEVA